MLRNRFVFFLFFVFANCEPIQDLKLLLQNEIHSPGVYLTHFPLHMIYHHCRSHNRFVNLWLCGRFNDDDTHNATKIPLLITAHLCFNCNFWTRYQSFECISSCCILICCSKSSFLFEAIGKQTNEIPFLLSHCWNEPEAVFTLVEFVYISQLFSYLSQTNNTIFR